MTSSLSSYCDLNGTSNSESETTVQCINETALSGGLGPGMGLELNSQYFDIYDFMADQTLIEVITKDSCPFGGFIDKTAAVTKQLHLGRNHRIFVPFATAIILHRAELVHINIPSIFDETTQKNLQLNPILVDIKSMHPYYFEFGIKVANLLEDQNLRTVLLTAAERRMIALMKLANDQVDVELKALQSSGGLISTGTMRNPTDDISKSHHHSVFVQPGRESYLSLDLGLFIQSLSASEAQAFRRRKEELFGSLSLE